MKEWIKVKSSAIKELQYNPHTRELFVKFKGDKIYKFSAIERKEWFELLAADSVGKYFNDEIQAHQKGEPWEPYSHQY